MKILKYNIKKPERSLNSDHYFNYRGLTRKERRTKYVVTVKGIIPAREYYAAIVNFDIRLYNDRMETYNLLCAQKRNHLIKQITKQL